MAFSETHPLSPHLTKPTSIPLVCTILPTSHVTHLHLHHLHHSPHVSCNPPPSPPFSTFSPYLMSPTSMPLVFTISQAEAPQHRLCLLLSKSHHRNSPPAALTQSHSAVSALSHLFSPQLHSIPFSSIGWPPRLTVDSALPASGALTQEHFLLCWPLTTNSYSVASSFVICCAFPS